MAINIYFVAACVHDNYINYCHYSFFFLVAACSMFFLNYQYCYYVSIAVCTPSCLYGNCTSPGVCNCTSGWTGGDCSVGNNNSHNNNYHDSALMTVLILPSMLLMITDINECGTDNGGCEQICTNTNSSYMYYCSCNSGYILDGDGHTCNGELSNGVIL